MKFEGYAAFLFDCDGTIADSMPLHLQAWNRALNGYGVEMSEDLHSEWAGRPTARIVELLNKRLNLQMPVETVVRQKEDAYLDILPQVRPVTSVMDVIVAYHGHVPFAVVSGSPRDSVIKTLTHLGIVDRFETILGAEDYAHGKPAPDCFLEAAKRIGVSPEKCLVFEDAELGIQAAKAARMSCVRIDSRSGNLSEVCSSPDRAQG